MIIMTVIILKNYKVIQLSKSSFTSELKWETHFSEITLSLDNFR